MRKVGAAAKETLTIAFRRCWSQALSRIAVGRCPGAAEVVVEPVGGVRLAGTRQELHVAVTICRSA
jgi:hypothetical protein